MLFSRYHDEAEFRAKFVKPLLNRLGFYGVDEQHGSQEFGKDFVFSELHRLGGMRHYAAQVKHEEAISQGKMVDGLLSQIRQAFAKPFTRPDSPRECYVCAVYVFNSGDITPNAKDYLLAELSREKYGDNVHLFDGHRLALLNETSGYATDRNVRMRLMALNAQLRLNDAIFESLLEFNPEMQTAPDGGEARRIPDCRAFIFSAVESFMTEPLPDTDSLTEALFAYWQRATIVQTTRQRFVDASIHRSFIERQSTFMKEIARKAQADAAQIATHVEDLMPRFRPIV